MRPVTLQTGYSRPDFDALLASREFSFAEAFTFRLQNGLVLTWTNGQQTFTVPPCDGSLALETYNAQDVLISGLKFRISNGSDSQSSDPQTSITVDDQTVTLTPNVNEDVPTVVGGVPLLQAVMQGAFRAAVVQRDRWFFKGPGSVLPVGGCPVFYGLLTSIEQLSKTQVAFKVKSDPVLLNMMMPRNLYQPSCQYTVYSTGCGVDRTAYAAHAVIGASPSESFIPWTSATAQFTGGTVTIETGPDINVTRSIRKANASGLWLAYPLPYLPAAGDMFVAYPGCDRQFAGGCAYFNNQSRWRATPNVPPANYAV